MEKTKKYSQLTNSTDSKDTPFSESPLKRVLAIHDISGVGKCSITAVLPIISAAGIECSVLPTAVLSTHTGGFSDMICVDFEEQLLPFVEHWAREEIHFDSIYTGYLASAKQAEIVSGIITSIKERQNASGENDVLVVVDPVMADKGKLYAHFDQSVVDGMKGLAAYADVLVPNLTEAVFLLGEEYPGDTVDIETVEDLLRKTAALGPKRVVMTDISIDYAHLGAACYDSETDKVTLVMSDRILGSYHGTGDVFASALTSALVYGFGLEDATRLAVDFTCASIERSSRDKSPTRMGVRFEAELGEFAGIFK